MARTLSNQAAAAKAIRQDLKRDYPEVKFSVTSQGYSGGDNVSVSWVDGPTERQVERIVGKYEMGHFDGSIDLYEYSNRRDDIPQTRYVHTRREWSRATLVDLVEVVNRRFGYELRICDERFHPYVDPASNHHTGHGWQDSDVWRLFCRTPFLCASCHDRPAIGDEYCAMCGAPLTEDAERERAAA